MFIFGCLFFCAAVILTFPYIGKIVNLYGDLKMTKAIKATLVALVLSSASYGVYAACGDSTCSWDGDSFVCKAEDSKGQRLTCTEDNPCLIDCN